MKKIFVVVMFIFIISDAFSKNIIDTFKIGTKYKNSSKTEKIQYTISILTERDLEVTIGCYTFTNYKGYNFRVYVDEEQIIRAIEVQSSNMFYEINTYTTKDNYSIHSSIYDLETTDIKEIKSIPFWGRIIFLKSGWGLSFYDANSFNPLNVHCELVKVDEIFFNLQIEKTIKGFTLN